MPQIEGVRTDFGKRLDNQTRELRTEIQEVRADFGTRLDSLKPAPDGLIVHPDRVPPPPEAAAASRGDETALPVGTGGGAGDSGRDLAPEPGSLPDHPAATEFYARFDLDPIRGIRQLGEILEHITARLGPDVRLELEVRAASAEGYDDATRRIVTENAASLKARAAEFE